MEQSTDKERQQASPLSDWEGLAPLLEALVAASPDVVIATDAGGAIRALSPSALRIFGWATPPASLAEWPAEPRLYAADAVTPLAAEQTPLACALRGEAERDCLLCMRFSGASEGLMVQARYAPLRASGGALQGALLCLRDVTEEHWLRVRLEEHRAQADLRASLVADVSAQLLTPELIRRALGRLGERFVSLGACYGQVGENLELPLLEDRPPPGAASLVGTRAALRLSPEWAVALLARRGFAVADVEREAALEPFAEPLRQLGIRAFASAAVGQGELLRGVLLLYGSAAREWSEHELATLRLIAEYLSLALLDAHREEERRAAQSELEWSARHDRLTGLANRALFTGRLEQAIRRARRTPEHGYAVLFLDFDYFKYVNDSLGHEAGDQLLIEIAARLRSLRGEAGANYLPARLGGDEFVLLLEDVAAPADAERIAERLQNLLSAPHRVANQEVTATASIGIVLDDGRYQRAEDVLRDADTAMYHAKQRGKARHVVFDQEMHAAVVRRLTLERELRRAVERAEFVAHYQPIVELRAGRLVGFEALLRWQHPERGLVPPGEFIPLSEEIGLVVPMGEWILAHAAGQLREWRDRFPALGPLAMSVNVSKRQIVQPGLVACVERVLRDTGLPPAALKLEITESVVMENPADAAPVLRQIEQLGVQLCMDDFGTGHSSLGTLQRFPIHVLKVDRSFISSIEDRPEYAAITQAIVTLAHSLHMRVVAEGVEKREHLELLLELECDEAQGFFFARPMPAAAAAELLSRLLRGEPLRA